MRLAPLAIAIFAAAATAQRPELTRPSWQDLQPVQPVQPVPQDSPVQIAAIDADLLVDGPAMRVTQRITLANPTARAQEFDLIFPLGDGAVISGLNLSTGDVTLEGQLYSSEEARRIYRDIVRRTKDPALLEHYGEAMFRARVFPVPAGGTQVLTLSYNRVLRPEGDLTRLHLPLTSFRRSTTRLAFTCKGEIIGAYPITTLYSPTHELALSSLEELGTEPRLYRSTFRVDQPKDSCELDFLLYFKARSKSELLDVTLLSERPDPDEAGYFMAVINGVPGADLEPEPKNVVFVLDRSGSMDGVKLEQARASLAFMVERLRPIDRFNIVSYSSGADYLAPALLEPTAQNLASARLYLDRIAAEGGTNIGEALTLALDQFPDTERLNQVVFLTDGLPTVGVQDVHALTRMAVEKNAKGARVVVFGVGFDVNGVFLDRLAAENRGMSEYVLPNENIEDKVPGFYARMQTPLVLDAEIDFGAARVFDVFPRSTGDIYGGHQLLIAGRYRAPGAAVLTIRGRRGGVPVALPFALDLAAGPRPGARDLVARMWASKKVGFLVDEIRLHGENPELVEAIVRLGTRFGILTEYTSFLAAPETDLFALGDNLGRATHELERRLEEEDGSQGVAQAVNSKLRQRAAKVETANEFYDEAGELVVVSEVKQIGGKTFFLRGETWQDSTVPAIAATAADLEVDFFSDEFFALLDQNAWLASCVARTGDVTLEVAGVNVRLKGALELR